MPAVGSYGSGQLPVRGRVPGELRIGLTRTLQGLIPAGITTGVPPTNGIGHSREISPLSRKKECAYDDAKRILGRSHYYSGRRLLESLDRQCAAGAVEFSRLRTRS